MTCDCKYCKHKVKQYICSRCGNRFNECEAIYEVREFDIGDLPNQYTIQLCPICHPEMDKQNPSWIGRYIFKKHKD
jgi:hypothetical protein